MHASSYRKMEAFRAAYLQSPASDLRVLDVGSMAYDDNDSYRPIFGSGFEYVGLDLDTGPNVDITPSDPYCWTEIENESFDVVISGQTFEHNPYPWITMAEIARVLRPGGLVALIAPSRGNVHRYPLDCWRFYPDSASALCAYVGLDLLESFVEPDDGRTISGAEWGDFFMVARRENVDIAHLERIVSTRRPFPEPACEPGPAVSAYELALPIPVRQTPARRTMRRARRLAGRSRRAIAARLATRR